MDPKIPEAKPQNAKAVLFGPRETIRVNVVAQENEAGCVSLSPK